MACAEVLTHNGNGGNEDLKYLLSRKPMHQEFDGTTFDPGVGADGSYKSVVFGGKVVFDGGKGNPDIVKSLDTGNGNRRSEFSVVKQIAMMASIMGGDPKLLRLSINKAVFDQEVDLKKREA